MLQRSVTPKSVDINLPSGEKLSLTIRFSKRRSLALQVKDAKAWIASPNGVRLSSLRAFAQSKASWLSQQLEKQRQSLEALPQRTFAEGAYWPYRGREYPLHIQHHSRASEITQTSDRLIIKLSSRARKTQQDQIKEALIHWYQQQAAEVLLTKSIERCRQLNTQFSGLKLRNTRSKWGHCTRAGVLQYNWLIMQAPEPVIDYLVCHECCHLIHFNHSQTYWSLVAQQMPDFDAHRRWLKINGRQLFVDRPL